MLRFNEYVLLLLTRDWSTCWHSTHVFCCLGFESGHDDEMLMMTFYYLGCESGQHVEIIFRCSSTLDSRVVDTLTFYHVFYCI